MANINLVTANKVEIVEAIVQMTLPAAEAIAAGSPVRVDPTNGKFTNANGTNATEAQAWGVAARTVATGMPVTAVRLGVMDGYNFSGNNYYAPIYLSDTDGRLGDTAGTVSTVIGRVIPGTSEVLGAAYSKLLFVDCRG